MTKSAILVPMLAFAAIAGCGKDQPVSAEKVEPGERPVKAELCQEQILSAAKFFGAQVDLSTFQARRLGTGNLHCVASGVGVVLNEQTGQTSYASHAQARAEASSDTNSKIPSLPDDVLREKAMEELTRFVGRSLSPEWSIENSERGFYRASGCVHFSFKQSIDGHRVLQSNSAKIVVNARTGKTVEVEFRDDFVPDGKPVVTTLARAKATAKLTWEISGVMGSIKNLGMVYALGYERRSEAPDQLQERKAQRKLALMYSFLLKVPEGTPTDQLTTQLVLVNANTGLIEGVTVVGG